jgi:hypothetical protein
MNYQLNRWNFVKVPGEARTYTHPRFKRGDLELCKTITCSGQSTNPWSYVPARNDASRPSGARAGDAVDPLLVRQQGLPNHPNVGLQNLQYAFL